ncbi:hypothetical protein CKQ90_32440, partial [Klebsiella pneumoniae]
MWSILPYFIYLLSLWYFTGIMRLPGPAVSPPFALIAHYIVASERGIEALRATIVFGMWSILPYF